jgi:hypothetical protein
MTYFDSIDREVDRAEVLGVEKAPKAGALSA